MAFPFHLRLRRLHSAYDLVKTILSESEAEVEELNPITKRGNVLCDWFIVPLLLPTLTIWFSLDHKRNVSDGVVSGVGRNGNVLILLTPIPSRLWLRLRLRFLIFTRSSALTTPLTTPTPTPLLVKTSLKSTNAIGVEEMPKTNNLNQT